MDAIDFIMKMERLKSPSSTKRKAILKAKQLIGAPQSTTIKIKNTRPTMSTKSQSNQASRLNSTFTSYQKALKNHSEAKSYCHQRGLDLDFLEVGYKSRRTKDKWGRGCIIFPLKNVEGDIVSLYGRGITGSSHYYQSNRCGLYPSYPDAQTKRLILTESVIDAASLYQIEAIRKDYQILALYGTNGLSKEHLEAINQLKYLEETIFFMDSDKAGPQAVQTYAETLQGTYPTLRLSNIIGLEDEDVNSILQAHAPAILVDMVAKRKSISLAKESSTEQSKRKEPNTLNRTLNCDNPHNLIYRTRTATYYVKGGVRHSIKDLDSLKITLVVQNVEGRKSRNKVDLYEDKQIEKVCRTISDKLGLRYDMIELDVHRLTDELEHWRDINKEIALNIQVNKGKVLTAEEQQKCLAFLREKNLLKRINVSRRKKTVPIIKIN